LGHNLEDFLKKIRNKGLKLTPRRKAIIQLFIDSNIHMTPEDVWYKLRRRFDQCGLPSVYRNLESLADCGILTRIQQFDRKKHYGLCTYRNNRHHHHIVCIKCGKVDAIEECAITPKKEIKGFKVVSHYVQVNGVCFDCANE
jgi:Fur family ferric uptake transcriptional regulator